MPVEAWNEGTVATVGPEAEEVVIAEAGLSIKVVVVVVVLALLWDVAADREETGMLTSIPPWPLVIDKGSWMRSGWPAAIMLLPLGVFSSVPVELWVVMPPVRVEPALEVVVISWRMGACETMAVEVGVWIRPVVEASRNGFAVNRKK